MIINELDVSILREFDKLEKGESKATTWTIMNHLYPNCKNDEEKRAKHNLIKIRLKKMEGDLFIITKKKDRWLYELVEKNINFCKNKFPSGSKNCLMICIDRKWNIFEL